VEQTLFQSSVSALLERPCALLERLRVLLERLCDRLVLVMQITWSPNLRLDRQRALTSTVRVSVHPPLWADHLGGTL